MARKLDSIDRRILSELQANGRLPIVELANRVHLTKTPCAQRVRRLEKTGVIKGYSAELDPQALDADFIMVVEVSLSRVSDNAFEEFNTAVKRIPEIEACYMIAGQFEYVLVVRTSDITHYRNVLNDQIGRLPAVQQTNSYVVMESVIDRKSIPIQPAG